MKEEDIIKDLGKLLTTKRLDHSLRVRDTARDLALLYGEDAHKAALAGLLHDCAKGYSHEELMNKSNEYGIELDDICLYQKGLIHGPLGAEVARDLFNIDDPSILSAIEYHTYGKKDMTTFQKIIYLADLIEPGRDFEGVEKLRDLARDNLDSAVLKALEDTIIFTITRGILTHPNTLEARNSLIIKEEDCCQSNQRN